MALVTKNFVGVDTSAQLLVKAQECVVFTLAGTFSAVIVLERSLVARAGWTEVARLSGVGNLEVTNETTGEVPYRMRCIDYTSGTAEAVVESFANQNQGMSLSALEPLAAGTLVGNLTSRPRAPYQLDSAAITDFLDGIFVPVNGGTLNNATINDPTITGGTMAGTDVSDAIVVTNGGDTVQTIAELGNSVAAAAISAALDATRAEEAADDAEAYRDAAQNYAQVYDTIAAGLAATSDGGYFRVRPGGSDGLPRLTLYRDTAGVATFIDSLATGSEMDEVIAREGATVREILTNDYDEGAQLDTDEDNKFIRYSAPYDLSRRPYEVVREILTNDYPEGSTLGTDEDNKLLSAAAPTASTAGLTPAASEGMAAEFARGIIWEEMQKYATLVSGGVPATPAEASGAQAISYDSGLYGAFVNQCIPIIEFTGGRLWRTSYGNQSALGTDPESWGGGVTQYIRVDYTDDLANGALPGALSWQPAFYLRPLVNTTSMMDTQLTFTHDGQLVVLYSTKESGKRRTVRSVVVTNPVTGSTGNFILGADTFFAYGFAHKARLWGTETRVSCSETVAGLIPPFASWLGHYWYRIKMFGSTAVPELIAMMPFMTDLAEESYREASYIRIGADEVLMNFRGDNGQWLQRSPNRGLLWDTETEFPAITASSKADLSRSPSGRPVYVYNAANSRTSPSILLGAIDGDASVFDYRYEFDDRNAPPNLTYFCPVYGTDDTGAYNGNVYISYDRGRGSTYDANGNAVPVGTPGSTTYNDLVIAVVSEQDIVDGTPTVTRYTSTS